MNKYYDILKGFDPNTSAREIIRHALDRFRKSPSMYWAQRLEEYGVQVDFDNYQDCFLEEADFNRK